MKKELQEKIEALKNLDACALLCAYDRVRYVNMQKKTMGLGEDSGIYEQECHREIIRRMEREA